eukprot:COSAG01_NODE_4478_length_4986_cov_3.398813_5_plen_224_part_00
MPPCSTSPAVNSSGGGGGGSGGRAAYRYHGAGGGLGVVGRGSSGLMRPKEAGGLGDDRDGSSRHGGQQRQRPQPPPHGGGVDLLGMGDEEEEAAAAASASVQEALASAADRAQGVHVRAQMRALFEEMDTDGDGALSGGEIVELAARLGVGTLDEAVSDIPPSLLLLRWCCCLSVLQRVGGTKWRLVYTLTHYTTVCLCVCVCVCWCGAAGAGGCDGTDGPRW